MNNAKVTKLGGNQYRVEIGKESETVDLDGYTIMSDDDYEEIEKAGLVQDDMWCPNMWNVTGDNDYFFKAALEFDANYSGFDAERYIEENQEEKDAFICEMCGDETPQSETFKIENNKGSFEVCQYCKSEQEE